jgi:hypothetical protein
MKKIALVFLVLILILVMATPALAGGDKNMGSEGQGEVERNKDADRGPFERPDCGPPGSPCRPFVDP